MVVVRRWLWSNDYGPSWVMVQWSRVVGPMVVVLILGCGSWSDGCGSWSDGPMEVGRGPMVDDCGPMVISLGSDGPMVVVLVPRSRCSVFNGLDFFFLLLFVVTGGSGWRRRWWRFLSSSFFCGLWLRVDLAWW